MNAHLLIGKLQTVATLARAGVVRPQRPDRLLRAGVALGRWGATPAAGYTAAAARHPDDLALIDEAGTLTFQAVHERSNALARALAAEGIRPGDGVAIMCRNHRGWVLAYVATNKLGAHALLLNTAFSGPQLADVARREDPRVVVFDAEFAAVLEAAAEGRKRFIAWHEPDEERGVRTLDELIDGGDGSDLLAAARAGQGHDPHLGHHGHAEGGAPQAAPVARPGGRPARAHPAARPQAHDDRRAALPLVGLRALHARPRARPRRSCSSAGSTRRRRSR